MASLYASKRLLVENGIALSKEFKKAVESFVGSDGKRVEALPERYVVTVVSSYNFDAETGYSDMNVLTYKVTKEIFDSIKFGTRVKVTMEMNMNVSKISPVALEIIK